MVGHQVRVAGDVEEEDPGVGAPGETPDQHQGSRGHNQLLLSLQNERKFDIAPGFSSEEQKYASDLFLCFT